jgi:hypothetical protein
MSRLFRDVDVERTDDLYPVDEAPPDRLMRVMAEARRWERRGHGAKATRDDAERAYEREVDALLARTSRDALVGAPGSRGFDFDLTDVE